jgi:DNA repair protein RadC
LRERFLKSGLAGFAEHEIVELLLTLAIPRCDVKAPAKALIACFGNLRGILDAPIGELERVAGTGPVTAVGLKVIRAAASLYLQQSAECRPAARFHAVEPGDCCRLGQGSEIVLKRRGSVLQSSTRFP